MRYFILFILPVLIAGACNTVSVYEKQVDLPDHEWQKHQNAVIRFTIKDSTTHQLFLVTRHTRQFPFNRLIVNLLIQDTTKKTLQTMHITAPLTDNRGNWNGEVMDDIYYHRIKITPPVFLRPGEYRFVLQQDMKEVTLHHILNVGIALDK